MATLLIGFDRRPGAPGDDLDAEQAFRRAVKSLSTGAYAQEFASMWLISTRKTPAQVRDRLEPLTHGAPLLVLDVTRDLAAWSGYTRGSLMLQKWFRVDHATASRSAGGSRRAATSGSWNGINTHSRRGPFTGVQRGHSGTVVLHGRGDDDRPYVGIVEADGECRRLEVPGTGPTSAVAVSDELVVVVEGDPPALLLGDEVGFRPAEPPLVDAVRLWPVCEDEHLRVVVLDRDGALQVLDPEVGFGAAGGGPRPASDDPVSLLVSQGEVDVVVAGRLRGDDGVVGEQVWVHDFHSGWSRVAIEAPPDAFTDLLSDQLSAGHRHGLPVLYDASGAEVPVPAVPLDPDHPAVLVVGVLERGTVLALQSAETGPQLWVGSGDDWSVELLPPGRLRAACLTEGDHTWVVMDAATLTHCRSPWPST